jgi:hypothetical protein
MTKLLTGLALACSLATAAWAETWPLDPGKGVGPIRLGAPMLSPTKYLTPDRKLPGSLAGGQNGIYLTYKEGIETDCQNGQIILVVIKNTTFTTGGGQTVEIQVAGGLKIGSSANQVQGAFGTGMISNNLPTAKGYPQKTYYAWPTRGVGVITVGGKVTQFEIFPAK